MSDEQPPVPPLFAEVVGQPAAVAALRAAARQPVHAYLFRGPPGSGSRPAARAFAAALLCPTGGCGACEACRRALAGTHPDLVLVERTGASLGIDDARRLVALAQRRPFEADRQVLVVADVHLATRSAPALLKTVEEPPPSSVFVLLADDLPPELVTVASRCVEIPFPPVPTASVAGWLESRGVAGDRAAMVAEGAAGDLDRARLLAEDAGFADRLALWRSVPSRLDGHGATAGSLARQLLSAVDAALAPLRARHAIEIEALAADAEAFGDRGVPGRKDTVDRQHREERRWRAEELRAGLGMLARAYRERLLGALPGGAPDEARGYGAAVELVTRTAAALRRNPNETLLMEALLVRLGRLDG
ncbi:MAG: ATP-binding protein [Acidimicrobiales bacterium]